MSAVVVAAKRLDLAVNSGSFIHYPPLFLSLSLPFRPAARARYLVISLFPAARAITCRHVCLRHRLVVLTNRLSAVVQTFLTFPGHEIDCRRTASATCYFVFVACFSFRRRRRRRRRLHQSQLETYQADKSIALIEELDRSALRARLGRVRVAQDIHLAFANPI